MDETLEDAAVLGSLLSGILAKPRPLDSLDRDLISTVLVRMLPYLLEKQFGWHNDLEIKERLCIICSAGNDQPCVGDKIKHDGFIFLHCWGGREFRLHFLTSKQPVPARRKDVHKSFANFCSTKQNVINLIERAIYDGIEPNNLNRGVIAEDPISLHLYGALGQRRGPAFLKEMTERFYAGARDMRDLVLRRVSELESRHPELYRAFPISANRISELSSHYDSARLINESSSLVVTDPALPVLDLERWRARQREALLKDKQEAERRAAEEEAEHARAAAEKARLKAEAEAWAAHEARRLRTEEDERQRQAAEEEQRRQVEEAEHQRAIAEEERRCQREEAERSRKLAVEKAEQDRRRKAEEEERQRRVTEEQAEQERRRLRAERVKVYSPDMTGQEFERYLAYQLSRRGLVPRVTGGAGDRGADIVLDTPLRRAVIQAKHHNKRVGNKAVQEVITARGIYEKRTGKKFDAWVIAPQGFTPQAESDARELGVILVEDPERFFDTLNY